MSQRFGMSQVVLVVKNPTSSAGDLHKRHRFGPWVGKIPWRRAWQPPSVMLLGKSHGQRSLAGYCPWGHKRVRHDWATKQQPVTVLIKCEVPLPCTVSCFRNYFQGHLAFLIPLVLVTTKTTPQGFLGDSVVKTPSANPGSAGLIPGLGRSPGEGNGIPLQYCYLGNHMDRGA